MLHKTYFHSNLFTVTIHTECAFPGAVERDMDKLLLEYVDAMGIHVHEKYMPHLVDFILGKVGGLEFERRTACAGSVARPVSLFTFAEQTCFADLRKHINHLSSSSGWGNSLFVYENTRTKRVVAVAFEELLWGFGDDE